MPEASQPILCYVTDRRGFLGDESARIAGVLQCVRAGVAAGLDWIQIREKDLATRPLLALVEQAVTLARGTSTRILVNDRLDVALAAGAAGVHLGGESMPARDVAEWLGHRKLSGKFMVGVSGHSLAEAQAAEREGANYIFFGPVFATPEKSKYGAPQGVERLAEVCNTVKVPVLAIGGITPEIAPDCLRAGAAGIAAIRMFQQTAILPAWIQDLRRES